VVFRRVAALIAALGLGGACSLPALDADDYRAKAEVAVDDAISQANSAILATRLRELDRLPSTMSTVLLEDVERAAAEAAHGFGSVLPPDPGSDRIRARILPVLNEVADLVSRMRFAARRGDAEALRELRSTLAGRVAALEGWLAAA
jgi:hypothetical protein